ncbi:Anti-sigma-K factor RskA [Paracoccus isoporae]|uniref:Anti-sigma-K factor RskA n=1 Tax=Paracoccus isoporae TaxID=591205 RepID=A0A1G6ZFN9_9RHOB|nr:anti-sigma factor [Paracoccus isoporae]SDE01272.1 Anti-sigma-K factor RskA [Paracoccus isoporae]
MIDDTSRQDPPELDPRDIATAGEYVLGTLPLAEREAFRRRLLAEPALAAEVTRWESHFDPIADEVRPVGPPPTAWPKVERRLFAAPSDRIAAGAARLWKLLALGSALAAAVLVALLWLGQPDRTEEPLLWVSDMVSADSSVRLTALYDETDGDMRVSVAGTPPSPGRDFELWLIQGDLAPISLGVMPHEGHTQMPVPPDLQTLVANATLAITDEPSGGAPGGVATGPIVAQAEMRRI